MLITIFKMAKAFVLAAVVTDIVIDLTKAIYNKITAKAAADNWNDYLEDVYPTRYVDPIATDINK